MSERQTPKKRHFWQLHLSTLLIVLLADAALFPVGDWFYREHFGDWFMIVPMALAYASMLVAVTFASEYIVRRRLIRAWNRR